MSVATCCIAWMGGIRALKHLSWGVVSDAIVIDTVEIQVFNGTSREHTLRMV